MHKTAVAYAIGKMLQLMGLILTVPIFIALYDLPEINFNSVVVHPEIYGLVISTLFSLIFGSLLVIWFRGGRDLQGIKEGYAIVTFGWIALAFVSSIPFTLYFMEYNSMGLFEAFTNGFFEVMSGLTTTGCSVISDVESLPNSLLFLRALTHWLGGMGIITLALVIFPAMGVVGYQMFRGEVPGPTTEKLFPRLAQTASILWGVYALLTAIETGMLMTAGMSMFDAVCHSFSTMATGGFSNNNNSIAGYNSDAIEWIIMIFMFLAGVNFILHFKALRGNFKPFKLDKEFRFYCYVLVSATIVIASVLYFQGMAPQELASDHFRSETMDYYQFNQHYSDQDANIATAYDCIRVSLFQSLAIVTTTGFVTADFDLWHDFLRFFLVFLMFFGGCAGSTGGGIKIVRVMIVAKVTFRAIRKLTQPRLVAPVKIGSQMIEDSKVISVISFVLLFIFLFVVTAAAMTLFVPDLTTAITCSIATIGNIGPGLAGIGPVENFGWIPLGGKWILIFSMLLGRLEIFTVLIVLRPSVWKK